MHGDHHFKEIVVATCRKKVHEFVNCLMRWFLWMVQDEHFYTYGNTLFLAGNIKSSFFLPISFNNLFLRRKFLTHKISLIVKMFIGHFTNKAVKAVVYSSFGVIIAIIITKSYD